MLKAFNKSNLTGASKLFILMALFFSGCLTAALGQDISTLKIAELLNINALQINTPSVEHSVNDKPSDWILVEGNASLVVQIGNRNLALIEQIRGVGNVAKVLQQGHNNSIGYEYADKKEYGIYQSGSRNYTDIKQFGNQNRSEAFQYGNSNEINIVQHGGTEFFIDYKSIVNKSTVSQTGNGNSATITQTFYP